ncbi:Proteasome-associated ATPase [Streptomyces alboniger]
MAAHDDDMNRGIRPGRGSEDPAGQIAYLEQEIAVLRRKLADSPRHTRILEERIVELQTNLAGVSAQNERLANTLREARDQIVALKEEVDRLAQPPAGFGVFLRRTRTAPPTICTGAANSGVNVRPSVALEEPRAPARRTRLNERAQRGRGHGVRARRAHRHPQGDPRGRRARPGARAHRRGTGGTARRAAAGRHHPPRRRPAARTPLRLRLQLPEVTNPPGKRQSCGTRPANRIIPAEASATGRTSSPAPSRSTCTRTTPTTRAPPTATHDELPDEAGKDGPFSRPSCATSRRSSSPVRSLPGAGRVGIGQTGTSTASSSASAPTTSRWRWASRPPSSAPSSNTRDEPHADAENAPPPARDHRRREPLGRSRPI